MVQSVGPANTIEIGYLPFGAGGGSGEQGPPGADGARPMTSPWGWLHRDRGRKARLPRWHAERARPVSEVLKDRQVPPVRRALMDPQAQGDPKDPRAFRARLARRVP
ncbi:hypothetical protein GCM10023334_087430 [Nonomuraea thailandensis]